MTDRRQRLGQTGEALAAQHLVRRGFDILERNYRTRWGELDIVAFDGRVLVFCEVKTRRASVAGTGAGARMGAGAGAGVPPLDSVHVHKRRQVRRMAGCWLRDRPGHPYAQDLRFDAIGVRVDGAGRLVSLEHLEGAF
ncbi:MAG: YraN family protein [Solirubrobacteraceae bacterium]